MEKLLKNNRLVIFLLATVVFSAVVFYSIQSPKQTVIESVKAQGQGLTVQNGWLVIDGKVIWGYAQHNSWWRGSASTDGYRPIAERPNITRRAQAGDSANIDKPNKQEDLDLLTDNMKMFAYPAFEHNYGLWYDRRRDVHDTSCRADANYEYNLLQQPWGRSGSGQACDGGTEYDLTQFNTWYFNRLKEMAQLSDQKETILIHNNYMQHNLLEGQKHYVDFPWRPENTIQNTGLPSNQSGAHSAFYDVQSPSTRKTLHERYIKKVLDEIGGYNNVIYYPSEEFTGPLSFAQFWVEEMKKWEQQNGEDVIIGMSAVRSVLDNILADPAYGPDIDVIDTRNWWYKADGTSYEMSVGQRGRDGGGFKQGEESSPEQIHRKTKEYRDRYPDKAIIDAIISDDEVISRKQAWAFLTGGGSLIIRRLNYYESDGVTERDPSNYGTPPDYTLYIQPTYDFINNHLSTKLPLMDQRDELVIGSPSDVWALADIGQTYLVYTMNGDNFSLNLTADTYDARWFNPATGEITDLVTVSGGDSVTFLTPGSNVDMALLLENQTSSLCDGLSCGDPCGSNKVCDHLNECIDKQSDGEICGCDSVCQSGSCDVCPGDPSNCTWQCYSPDQVIVTNLTPANYQAGYLQQGDEYYIDRTYTLTTIPLAYQNFLWIKTANADKQSTGNSFLNFNVDKAVTVYIAYDERLTPPSWLSSWTAENQSILTSSDNLDLYSQSFCSGQISLGGNAGPGQNSSMYSVLIKKNQADSYPSDDLNCDQIIDLQDLASLKSLWGQSSIADLNQNNITDVSDLGIMMKEWSN